MRILVALGGNALLKRGEPMTAVAQRANVRVAATALAPLAADGFDLNAIASIGNAIALLVFGLVTLGHLRVRDQTGARLSILLIGVVATVIVLVTFAVTTLVEEPSTLIAIVVVLLISIGVDVGWKRSRVARLAAS